MKIIRRLMCLLGIHKWEPKNTKYAEFQILHDYLVTYENSCSVCGKKKIFQN